ncbi:MAG TPA: amino acid racemase [Thermoguttaceae bacterium]|jgi:aspartate racemase|nr:amino acid racemase [Anaerolineales bacterium]
MTKHIGIVGVSYEGAALCYRTICKEGKDWLGMYEHPQVTMHTFNLNDYKKPSDADRWDLVGELILKSARVLAGAGAELLICPDNTVHVSIDDIIDQSPLPWLHIAEEVAREAEDKGYRNLGILGTQPLMEGPVYPRKLEKRGIHWQTPDLTVRQQVQQYIVGELIYGTVLPETRKYFQGLIEQFAKVGCDAVVLGCTEIPLLISAEDSVLPTLDSTRLLARAALREATS